jgi:hypothetical protein
LPTPQLKPVGQHPPLASGGHRLQPLAQLPVDAREPLAALPGVVVGKFVVSADAAAVAPPAEGTGTMTVTPLLVTSVELAVCGQEEESQLRPTRQQPPL